MTHEEQSKVLQEIRDTLKGRKSPIPVLVIEDNPIDADVAMAKLQAAGAVATWAKDSKETQDYLRSNDPYLVFLDMKLGSMSGLVVLDFIRLMKPKVDVLILTGAYDHDSAECKEALKKGARGVYLKPLSDDTIRILFTAP